MSRICRCGLVVLFSVVASSVLATTETYTKEDVQIAILESKIATINADLEKRGWIMSIDERNSKRVQVIKLQNDLINMLHRYIEQLKK